MIKNIYFILSCEVIGLCGVEKYRWMVFICKVVFSCCIDRRFWAVMIVDKEIKWCGYMLVGCVVERVSYCKGGIYFFRRCFGLVYGNKRENSWEF